MQRVAPGSRCSSGRLRRLWVVAALASLETAGRRLLQECALSASPWMPGTSPPVNVLYKPVAPAFFQWGNYAVATRQDFSLAGQEWHFPWPNNYAGQTPRPDYSVGSWFRSDHSRRTCGCRDARHHHLQCRQHHGYGGRRGRNRLRGCPDSWIRRVVSGGHPDRLSEPNRKFLIPAK